MVSQLSCLGDEQKSSSPSMSEPQDNWVHSTRTSCSVGLGLVGTVVLLGIYFPLSRLSLSLCLSLSLLVSGSLYVSCLCRSPFLSGLPAFSVSLFCLCFSPSPLFPSLSLTELNASMDGGGGGDGGGGVGSGDDDTTARAMSYQVFILR